MNKYSVDFEYTIKEFGNIEIEANNPEDAEFSAVKEIKDTFDDISDLKIIEVEEIV